MRAQIGVPYARGLLSPRRPGIGPGILPARSTTARRTRTSIAGASLFVPAGCLPPSPAGHPARRADTDPEPGFAPFIHPALLKGWPRSRTMLAQKFGSRQAASLD